MPKQGTKKKKQTGVKPSRAAYNARQKLKGWDGNKRRGAACGSPAAQGDTGRND